MLACVCGFTKLEVPRVNIFLVERLSDSTTVKWMRNGDGIINVSMMMMMGTMMRRCGLIKREREKRWLCAGYHFK